MMSSYTVPKQHSEPRLAAKTPLPTGKAPLGKKISSANSVYSSSTSTLPRKSSTGKRKKNARRLVEERIAGDVFISELHEKEKNRALPVPSKIIFGRSLSKEGRSLSKENLADRHGDSMITDPDLIAKTAVETKKIDDRSECLASSVASSFHRAKFFDSERKIQIEMASILLFDAIHDLPTRHRLSHSWDRALYLWLYGDTFRLYLCVPISLFNMSLVFYESFKLDLICQIFHLCHFSMRLYMRTYSDDGSRLGWKDIKKTVSMVLQHRSEQFEAAGFTIALVQTVGLYFFPNNHQNWMRVFRVFYLVDALKVLKRLVRNVVSTVIALREVFMLWVAITSFFALTAIVVWPPAETVQGAVFFTSLHRSVISFTFATFGAVNFPDVMLPTVNEEDALTSLFFIIFMLIIVVWLLNLCLAVVYQQYTNHVHKRWLHRYKTRRTGLLSAFILLDKDRDMKVNKEDFLLSVMRVKNLTEDDDFVLEFLWSKCDEDGNGFIQLDDFNNICDLLVCNMREKNSEKDYAFSTPYDGGFGTVDKESASYFVAEEKKLRTLKERFYVGGLYPQLRQVLITRSFRKLVIFCILASNLILIYNANSSLKGQNHSHEGWHLVFEIADYCFIFFFLAEMVLKVLACGLSGYLNTPWWKFDFFVALAGAFGKIMELESFNLLHLQQTSIGLRMAKVLRTVKLIRVLSRIQKFRAIISTTGKFVPIMPRFFLLFLVVLYIYGIIGMSSFGMDQQAWVVATEGSAYADSGYSVKIKNSDGVEFDVSHQSYVEHVNFNTPSNTLLTLFSLIMVNNWHIIHDAVELGTGINGWLVSLYFVSFLIISVIVAMNLLVSFFLESYSKEWQKSKFDDRQRLMKQEKWKTKSMSVDEGDDGSSISKSSRGYVELVGKKSGRQTQILHVANIANRSQQGSRNSWHSIKSRVIDRGVGNVIAHLMKMRPDDEQETTVCYICDAPLGFFNPSRECCVSRMVCCRKCCMYCIEPRLDGDMQVTQEYSIQLAFGYEPIAIENGTRQKLLRRWEDDENLFLGDIFSEDQETRQGARVQSTKFEKFGKEQNDYVECTQDAEDEVVLDDKELVAEMAGMRKNEAAELKAGISKLYKSSRTGK